MNKLSEVIKTSGITVEVERTSTVEPRFLLNENDYKNAHRVTLVNGEKTMLVYFFGGDGNFDAATVIEHMMCDFRANNTYTAKEWLEEMGFEGDHEQWEEEYQRQLKGRKISKEYKTAFLALVGRGLYQKMYKAEDDI